MSVQPKLGVVVASVRDGRAGQKVADWFAAFARTHGGFDVALIDLAQVGLPLLDEPHHPRLQKYTSERTRAWSAAVAATDAFVFVTPEYNYFSPPALINALDHLYVEWNYKAAGFVSYGGISGGLRSVQMTKQLLTTLKMVPLVEAVSVAFVARFIDAESGVFTPEDVQAKAATAMLNELVRWNAALRTLRA